MFSIHNVSDTKREHTSDSARAIKLEILITRPADLSKQSSQKEIEIRINLKLDFILFLRSMVGSVAFRSLIIYAFNRVPPWGNDRTNDRKRAHTYTRHTHAHTLCRERKESIGSRLFRIICSKRLTNGMVPLILAAVISTGCYPAAVIMLMIWYWWW